MPERTNIRRMKYLHEACRTKTVTSRGQAAKVSVCQYSEDSVG